MLNTINIVIADIEITFPPNVILFETEATNNSHTSESLIFHILIFSTLFLVIVYFLLLAFHKGKMKTIIITDKWIKKSGYLVENPGDLETYIVVYQNQNGKPKKGHVAYCYEHIYDEFEIGEMYCVLKKFKTIKEVRGKLK